MLAATLRPYRLPTMRVFYVDDSGDETFTTFTAVGVPVEQWGACSATWLTWRESLRDTHGVRVSHRFHATRWVMARGNPAGRHDPINTDQDLRRRVYREGLDVIAAMPGVQILTTRCEGDQRPPAYRDLVDWIDDCLKADDDHGFVILDGDSSEMASEHQRLDLATRRIVEDPWKRGARESQWLQVADLVAHAAFQQMKRNEERDFMWDWYEDAASNVIVRDPTGISGVRGWE